MQPGQPYGPSGTPHPGSPAHPGPYPPAAAHPYSAPPAQYAATPYAANPYGAPPHGPAPYGAAPHGAVPYGAAPFGAPPLPPGAAVGAYPGYPVPPHLIGTPPPAGLRVVRKPKTTGTIALPLVAIVLIALVCPSLPWFDTGNDSASLWDLMKSVYKNDLNDGWTAAYIGFVWIPLAINAFLLAMAATTDAKGWKITYAILFAIGTIGLVLVLATTTLVYTSVRNQQTGGSSSSGGVTAGIVLLVIWVVFSIGICVALFTLRGLAYRIPVGLFLLGAAILHAATVANIGGDYVDAEPWAYIASIGYVLAAVGAFIGPRYVRYYAIA